ncbi:MAG: D-alanyl-D-alanine carboxypeptidase [Firmicutes bacterium]|nr:D-alanyl-D-alanine carboxypeptidase [[Eubacterium] siraeum]MCM1487164.1 D-alanyl-D-alanine carboxypeptidase [Bacillota bacterium]
MKDKKIYRYLTSAVLAIAVFLQFSAGCKVKADFVPNIDNIYSEGVFMVNMDTDIVLYAKNEHQRYYPASITKIMTAIVVLEYCPDINASVRVGTDSTNEFWMGDPNKEDVSNAAFEAGQKNLTYKDCLYALMVVSACEAANVLALNLCGTVEDFTSLMNKKASDIGCLNTHFSDAHGLWEAENYSTPYDMYLISRYAYDHVPGFMEICDTVSYDFPPNNNNPEGYTLYNTNVLMRPSSDFYLEYVHGIKTGSIDYYYTKGESGEYEKHPGGRCLVTTAQKDGYTYMIVTMQAPYYDSEGKSYNYAAKDHYNLYEWAYANFVYQTVVSRDQIFTEVNVEQGENDRLQLIAIDDFTTIVPKQLAEDGSASSGETESSPVQKKVVPIYEEIIAPVTKGEVLGKLEIVYQGETIRTLDLVAAKSIERSQLAYLADKARALTDTSWFGPLLLLLVLCILADIVLMSVRRRKLIQEARRNERKRRRTNY